MLSPILRDEREKCVEMAFAENKTWTKIMKRVKGELRKWAITQMCRR